MVIKTFAIDTGKELYRAALEGQRGRVMPRPQADM